MQILKLETLAFLHIEWCRKGMDQELIVLHKNPETSYVKEEFSGIQNAAMALTSRDHINEDLRFSKI